MSISAQNASMTFYRNGNQRTKRFLPFSMTIPL